MLTRLRKKHQNKLEFYYVCVLSYRSRLSSRSITAILTLLTYYHIVWHFCAASDVRELESVQEKVLRAVYRSKTATYDTLLLMANLPLSCDRRLQDVAILMCKVKDHQPELIERRLSKEATVPRFSTQFMKHSIRFRGAVLWNFVSDYLTDSQNFKQFIRKVKLDPSFREINFNILSVQSVPKKKMCDFIF